MLKTALTLCLVFWKLQNAGTSSSFYAQILNNFPEPVKKARFLGGLLTIILFCLASVPRKQPPAFLQIDDLNPAKLITKVSAGPDSSRFTYNTLVSGLDEPMEIALLPNYDIVIVERKGAVKYFDNTTKELSNIAQFNVFSGIEDGLLGVAADPNFKNNHWLYFYYGVAGDKSVSQLARFELQEKKTDPSFKKGVAGSTYPAQVLLPFSRLSHI